MWHKKLIKVMLISIILIDFMGMATVVVLFPHLFLGKNITQLHFGSLYKFNVGLLGICLALYPLGQFLGATYFGKLSDCLGRKKVLVITLLGTIVGFFISGLAIRLGNVTMLMVGRLFTGLCAGNVAVSQAALIDVSENEENRTNNIALGQAAMGGAYIVGPIVGSVFSNHKLITWFDYSTPFWLLSILLVLILIFVGIFFTETIATFNNSIKPRFLDCMTELVYITKTSYNLRMWFLIWSIFVCGWWLFESYMPAFLLANFKFNTNQIGSVLAFNGGLYTLFQYTVIRKITNKISAINMFKLGSFCAGCGIISVGIVNNSETLYMSMSIFVMAMGFAIPGIITCISSNANNNEQGVIMGVVNSIQSISTVLVMLVGGVVYGINPHATVFIGGTMLLLSGFILLNKSFITKI